MTRALDSSTDAPHQLWTEPARAAAGSLVSAALLPAAVLSLGAAVRTNYGQFDPQAIQWLAVALVTCLIAVTRAGRDPVDLTLQPASHARLEKAIWLVAIAVQVVLLVGREPTVPGMAGGTSVIGWFRAGVVVTAGFAATGMLAPARGRGWCVGGMLAAHLAAGALLLGTQTPPGVDVIVFQHDACDALLRGVSPYSITFPDISPAGSDFYAPGISQNGRLLFGFPYPPLSLLLVLPAHLLGDFRFAGLFATTVAAGFITLTSRCPRSVAAAAMLLLTPMGFFVVWAGWTEPLAVMLLAGVVLAGARASRAAAGGGPSRRSRVGPVSGFLARRRRTRPHTDRREGLPDLLAHANAPGESRRWDVALILSLGLFLAVKQYTVLLLPLVPLLGPRGQRWRVLLGTSVITTVVTLPLAFWDLPGFGHSVVTLQFHQPYRADALSFLAPLHDRLPLAAASAIPFALVGLTIAWTLKACPRTPAGFALAASAVLLVFFAFNKQAFCNYYHLVIGALCCATASSAPTAAAAAPPAGRNTVRTR
jgi:hypothetical protein